MGILEQRKQLHCKCKLLSTCAEIPQSGLGCGLFHFVEQILMQNKVDEVPSEEPSVLHSRSAATTLHEAEKDLKLAK